MTTDGSCHCGNVKFSVEASFDSAMVCNCSICQKKGWNLAFVPAGQVTLHQGEDALQDYQFGKKSIHHVFCKTCGVAPFGRGSMPDGSAVYAINLRCLDDDAWKDLPVTEIDGRSL